MVELSSEPKNFIRNIIDEDLKSGKNGQRVVTRFPPEPNGYLHVGHAKSICLNFGIAQDYQNAYCNLRFDDTNPEKENDEYKESIKTDIRWLGFDWEERLYHASDYFDKLYDFAIQLIKLGKAYVCSLSQDEMRAHRGTLTEAGKESRDRNRSVAENLDLFARMRKGEFPDGAYTLRAKIDMTSGNINMRDPAIYRIKRVVHHQTGNVWCIYPMYDYTHCLSDSLENITHSLCTLEFQDHRPLYDWVLDTLGCKSHPQQIEFARLNINYTVMSKRKLKQLVDERVVSGWNDPRMPTISGMRRRGYSPESIRAFCERIGISKKETIIDMSILEECVRDDLNERAQRAFCVLDPIKVVIENIPEGKVENLSVPNHPQKPELGTRSLPFGCELYIEREDFAEHPVKGYHRLTLGGEVRLRYSYIIRCNSMTKDAGGNVVELRCTVDAATLGRKPEGRSVKGVIHWVPVRESVPAEVRLYERLFHVSNPDAEPEGFMSALNPESLIVRRNCRVEPSVQGAKPESRYQFERLGYFCIDPDSTRDMIVLNRTVGLRDIWSREST